MNFRNITPLQIFVAALVTVFILSLLYVIPTNVMTPQALINKGLSYEKSGRTALALEEFKKAAERFPGSYDAHLYYGKSLLESDEPKLAMEHLNKAVDIGSKSKYDAEIILSEMFINENNFSQAEKILSSIQKPSTEAKSKLASVYETWADKIFNTDRNSAMEKYKKALNLYGTTDAQIASKLQNRILQMYNDLINEYLSNKKTDLAINTLNESIKFSDNARAHIKLAEIYRSQKKEDLTIAEYEKAFKLDTSGTAGLYLSDMLVAKGVEFVKKKDLSTAKKYFDKAIEANPSIMIPAELLYSVAISSLKTTFIPEQSTNTSIPSISFVLTNKGKDNLAFLKAKIVFAEDGKKVGESEKILVSEQGPLGPGKSTPSIIITSPAGVDNINKKHELQATIYLAYNPQADWKIARELVLSKGRSGGFVDKDTREIVSRISKPVKPASADVKLDDELHGNSTKVTTTVSDRPSKPIVNQNSSGGVQPVTIPVQLDDPSTEN